MRKPVAFIKQLAKTNPIKNMTPYTPVDPKVVQRNALAQDTGN
jgi:hypothetical protein